MLIRPRIRQTSHRAGTVTRPYKSPVIGEMEHRSGVWQAIPGRTLRQQGREQSLVVVGGDNERTLLEHVQGGAGRSLGG
jgi:hypothetical protein